MAEAYFSFYADKMGLFFSAGLKKTELNPYAIKVMAEDNIDLSEHLSKSIKAFENTPFDYLLTVCDPSEQEYEEVLEYAIKHDLQGVCFLLMEKPQHESGINFGEAIEVA